ncbi:hypothetical protein [Streptomyces sp. UNOB3_S3]|uniref:hypothetical protein n=1 Tax=Streptomyces sp. UNOB3_S3 TaxID=2871682 RepID=UPI001E4CB138|nr:hypothetical protein [Streptomyces sp. UNOB3_S3]MCC3776147.1 hypothetical protein [Streptomyces sp. UNOB3_S3]
MRIRTVLPVALLAASGLFAGAGNASAAGGYPGFQCFKTADRAQYCSDVKVKNHAGGDNWIKTCPADVQKAISGKPYVLEKRPASAEHC